jgi:hypothetical protein
MLIAINRYMMVCKPDLYHRVFSESTTVLCCALPWVATGRLSILALVYGVAMKFDYTSITNLCGTAAISKSTNMLEKANMIIVVLTLTLPAPVVGLCSLRIYLRWKATQRAVISSTNLQQNITGNSAMRPDLQASIDDQSSLTTFSGTLRRKTGSTIASLATNKIRRVKTTEMAFVRSLFIVVVVFIVTYKPLACSILLVRHVTSDFVQLSLMVSFVNNSINWIIYGMLSTQFRQAYKRTLCDRKVTECLHTLWPSKFQRSIQPELRTEDTSFQAGPSANSKRLSRTSTTTRMSKTSGTHETLDSRHTIIE